MLQQPKPIGLLLCERVIVEEKARSISVIGRFNRLRVPAFPAEVEFTAFALLTDGIGKARLDLVINRLDTEEPVSAITRRVRIPEPLDELWLHLRVRNCLVPIPGAYEAVLFFDNELVAHTRFTVTLAE